METASILLLERRQEDELIRAAGGIPIRRAAHGRWEVAVIYRPAREDWTFPKGKLEPGESYEECALREVLEETGLRCRLGRFIGHTEYSDRKDRPKMVAYWELEVRGGSFEVNDEVSEIRWVDLGEAAQVLSYDRDRELLLLLESADAKVV